MPYHRCVTIHIGTIAKTGHSEYITIPKRFLRELGIVRKDQVAIAVVGGCIAIVKVDPRKLFNMRALRDFSAATKQTEQPAEVT